MRVLALLLRLIAWLTAATDSDSARERIARDYARMFGPSHDN
jgi:hypothetical protein